MTEAIGMAGMLEAPVVFIEVQRGGPSTGIPTKTEQADLNQVYGASQGDFPRVIVAPGDIADAYLTTSQAFNLAEKYQLPVIIVSDLLLSEHPETVEMNDLTHDLPVERGEIVSQVPAGYKRYRFTHSGVSPRVLPGTPDAVYVAATDDHDEHGILISDVFTSPPVRRKIQEKRMKKMDLLRRELEPPRLEGPAGAEVTLVGWGSCKGVIKEAADLLNASGVTTNRVHFKWLLPFHSEEALAILSRCKRTICVELNYTGQFARHLRAETGYSVHDRFLKYDGEPFEPHHIVEEVKRLLEGRAATLDVTLDEAREMAYHYIRTHLHDSARPALIARTSGNGYNEDVWSIEVVSRDTGQKRGEMEIGVQTGSLYSWNPVSGRASSPAVSHQLPADTTER